MWHRFRSKVGVFACMALAVLAIACLAAGQVRAELVDLGMPVCGSGKLPPLILRGSVEPVKNVILLIGDGEGIAQRTLTRIVMGGANNPLPAELMWEVGLANTHSADALVTDSAASATQMATGYWTNNGMLGMTAENVRIKTILELARELGKATGLVATTEITHATPAAFAAHVSDREAQGDIAIWLFKSRVDVLIGGGRDQFLPRSARGNRADERDVLGEFEFAGWRVFDSIESVKKNSSPRIVALLHRSHLPQATDRDYTLADMTREALKRLSQKPNGFFVMVEGSQIDWACHDNDGARTVHEAMDFEGAVQVAMDYARNHDDTLVIVVADHETGGLAIAGGAPDSTSAQVQWAVADHTGTPVAIYSHGPSSHLLGGHMYLADIPVIIARAWGVDSFGPPRQVIQLEAGWRK